MAKLSAHGTELLRLEFMTFRQAYMADGKILRNSGSGWKLHGNVKKGLDIGAVIANVKAKHAAKPEAYHAYVEALKDAVSLEQRWQLHSAIELMPDDPDGVWSTMEDHSFGRDVPDLDDIVKCCRWYRMAVDAAKALQAVSE